MLSIQSIDSTKLDNLLPFRPIEPYF